MLVKKQGQETRSPPCPLNHIFNRNDKSEHITHLDNVVRIIIVWSEWGDSNSRHLAPKPMSEPSCRPVAPSLTLSGTPAVPLWNSFALFVSGTAFVFWDLCGMKFCILKVLPTRFSPGREWSWLQKSAHKLRRINNEISAGVTLPTLSINGKCVVVAKTPSENVQTKKKLAHFL